LAADEMAEMAACEAQAEDVVEVEALHDEGDDLDGGIEDGHGAGWPSRWADGREEKERMVQEEGNEGEGGERGTRNEGIIRSGEAPRAATAGKRKCRTSASRAEQSRAEQSRAEPQE
jgi:hypothetical protein